MTLNINKDVKQMEYSYITGGNVKQYNYFGEILDSFFHFLSSTL